MSKFKHFATALLLAASASAAQADCLWLAGDALSYGWSLDDATAILSSEDNASLYTGTIYLEGGKDFKFLTTPDFGNEEYGSAPGATLTDGKIELAKGTNDEGYGKISVPENANYLITVDTQTMTATIAKSAYQAKEIKLCSLFLIGDATPNGWDVMKGTPLYQDIEKPYSFANPGIAFKAGSFKIATVLKGACSFDSKYFYFRDANDSAKIALGQEGDLQWSVGEAGNYSVDVNLDTDAIAITKVIPTGIDSVEEGATAENAEYYTLTGVRVANPANGVFICKRGSVVTKMVLR